MIRCGVARVREVDVLMFPSFPVRAVMHLLVIAAYISGAAGLGREVQVCMYHDEREQRERSWIHLPPW